MSVAGKFAVSSVGGRWAGWGRAVTKAQFFPLEATGQQIPGLDQDEHSGKVADVRMWWASIIREPCYIPVTWVV